MPTEKHSADDNMNCIDNSADDGATKNPDAMDDGIDGDFLLTKQDKEHNKEHSQTTTTKDPRRRSSFLEDFNLEDFDDFDSPKMLCSLPVDW